MEKNTTPTVDAIGELNFEGTYIPSEWYRKIMLPSGKTDAIGITLLAHFAYGTVTSDANELRLSTDYFQVNVDDLSTLFGLTERQIIDAISRLCMNRFIIQYALAHDEITKFFSRKKPQRLPILNYHVPVYCCAWCKSDTLVLHEHHYPIPKSEGGTDIVKLCPNCHAEYHYLEKCRFYTVNIDKLEANDEISTD